MGSNNERRPRDLETARALGAWQQIDFSIPLLACSTSGKPVNVEHKVSITFALRICLRKLFSLKLVPTRNMLSMLKTKTCSMSSMAWSGVGVEFWLKGKIEVESSLFSVTNRVVYFCLLYKIVGLQREREFLLPSLEFLLPSISSLSFSLFSSNFEFTSLCNTCFPLEEPSTFVTFSTSKTLDSMHVLLRLMTLTKLFGLLGRLGEMV